MHSDQKQQAVSGEAYTEQQVNKLSAVEVNKLFNSNKAKLSSQMVKSLDKSIIKMYSMGACAVLGMTNQDVLKEDMESDPFLSSALQRFTSKLYYRFGSFLAPLSIGLITSRHYLLEQNATDTNNGRRTNEEGKASN